MFFKPFLPSAIVALSILDLAGCTTPVAKVYQDEHFQSSAVFSHNYTASSVATCEAARRALLSQGYIVAEVKADIVNGQKSFQPQSDLHVEIAFHVVCVSDGPEGQNSSVFVNALQDRFTIKKTNSSASVGVGAVGAVSLPFGSSDDSLVKVASETIPAGPFYDRFFILTDSYLNQIDKNFGPAPPPSMHSSSIDPVKPAEKALPLIAPPAAQVATPPEVPPVQKPAVTDAQPLIESPSPPTNTPDRTSVPADGRAIGPSSAVIDS